jgi:short-subunit dehydrogenase
MSYFNNKVVVVTGGSDGIGRTLVEFLLDQGAKVATCGRNYDKLYSLQLKYAVAPLHTMTCDVSSEQDCKRFIESTLKTFGKIDILINNAGVSMRALFRESNIEAIKRIMDVNYWGAVYCTKYALESIIENKGSIAGISSLVGYRGIPGRSAYSASKHALQGWLEGLRVEMMNHEVNVLWIAPGFTTTNIRSNALDKDGKPIGESPMEEDQLMPVEECARIILNAIAKRKRSLVLTFEGKRMVFLNRFLPQLADNLIRKYFFKDGKLVK